MYSDFIALPPKTNLVNSDTNYILTDYFASSLNQPIYCPSSFCVNKVVFDSIGLYDDKITFGEDIDFNIRANTTFQLAYSIYPLVKYSMYYQNQITSSPMKNKVLPNLNNYEILARTNLSLKKYLDFHRYIFAKMYKIENDLVNYKLLKEGIHENNQISGLNYKQLLLLQAPPFLLRLTGKIKKYLVKNGYRFTSY
jgi:hypothetical protein